MKFENLKKEVVFAQQRMASFDGHLSRRWKLTDRLLVRISVHGIDGIPQLSIAVEGIYSWMEPEGRVVNFIERPISDLTMSDLRRVMAARAVFERWIAGEIDELPTDPPDTSGVA